MRVSVFGSGYVGLVVAACLAEVGNEVVCIDVDADKISRLNQGHVPIYEPGLAELIQFGQAANKITFTTDAQSGLEGAEVVFIAVGTPQDEDGSADLQYVLKVAETIGEFIQQYTVVVDKSTVPVGTADKVKHQIELKLKQRGKLIPYDVVSNPEFLKEGAAIEDFRRPDRIVVGTDSAQAEKIMRALYSPYTRNHDCLMVMDTRSAELTKYAANAMLATKISFMNQMANIADEVGADIEQVRLGIGADPRIGYHFIYPGCGYGGSCFGKDVQALIKTANESSCGASILEAVEQVNVQQKQVVFQKLYQHFNQDLNGKVIALWGLSFKPGTDDMRDAPARTVLARLWEHGAKVQAFDPQAMSEAKRLYGQRDDFRLAASAEQALEGADALIILTEWRAFRSPNFETIREALSQPVIVDGRNMYDPQTLASKGFHYYGIGRRTTSTVDVLCEDFA